MLLVTAEQMQDMDRETIKSFGIPGLVLMENAGRGAFDFFNQIFSPTPNSHIGVIAGRGNNGGDGFVMARYIMEKNIPVTVYLLASKDRVGGDAKINMDLFIRLCKKTDIGKLIELPDEKTFGLHQSKLINHNLYIDAVLGTGLNSDVRGFYKTAIELMNTLPQPVFSVDIPSGLNSDTGKPMGIAVKAEATATFAFAKIGHILFPGNRYSGQLKIIDIGIPKYIAQEKQIPLSLIQAEDVARLFPGRSFISHKGSYGHLLVIAGSPGKTGAAALCANAAMRCGTGLVTLGVAEQINQQLEPMVTEPMTHPLPCSKSGMLTMDSFDSIVNLAQGRQAMALGPGIGTGKDTEELVCNLIKSLNIPIVIDADALNCLTSNLSILKKKKAPVVLTPHPGEMSRLCGFSTDEIQADRLNISTQFAKDHDVTMVLKGAQTVISFPDGNSAVCPTGNPGMASGGMGDVLTGMIAGFCAQGMTPENASIAGTYIHGLCGDDLATESGQFGYLASDMVTQIPNTIRQHLK